ncbi:MAG TPA: hypothetical protein VL358_08250 [Caulobacteraceae bacterium]|jgi:hypothetical protein|nr:hypothetical protein [Caulobacteraceae bacterium]
MPAEDSPGSLTERARTAVRAALADALVRQPSPAEWMVRTAFSRPLPLPPLDLAALAIAGELGEAVGERRGRALALVAAQRARGAAPIAVVGDSHSAQLVRRAWRGERWMLPLHLLCTGASARGLDNPEAASGAGARVRAFLDTLASTPMPVVFKFGQVDVEFVFAFKRLETGAVAFDGKAFEAFADETIARYLAFLAMVTPPALRPHARVAGLFPPALSDAAWRKGYVNAHIAALHGPADPKALAEGLARLELPSLAERTALHKAFNRRLFAAALAAGFAPLFGFDALLGPDGTAATRFLGKARGANHHLGYAATRRPVLDQLWTCVD